jgi:perosamine synthetase
MMPSNSFIPVNTPEINQQDIDAVSATLREGWISGEGKYVNEFEENFSNSIGKNFGISVCNGTVALELAIEVLGLSAGDEVILPALTIISCLTPLLVRGIVPKFVDCNLQDFNALVHEIEIAITKKTRAIMVVHLFGLPVDMDPLLEISSKYEIPIIEDASEAHGVRYKNHYAGSFGLISTFSFYANKTLTTGEGGMLCTDDESIANKLRKMRNLSFIPEKRFYHEDIGWNYRLSSLQAALGNSQLSRMNKLVQHKKDIANIYNAYFTKFSNVHTTPAATQNGENCYWIYPILLKSGFPIASEFRMILNKAGIDTRPLFYPLNKQPLLRKFGLEKQRALPNSLEAYNNGFYLPSGTGMPLTIAKEVIERIEPIFERYLTK